MYPIIRPILFRLDPERVHGLTIILMQLVGRIPLIRSSLRRYFAGPSHVVNAFGITFQNPVGLAAGYDKDGRGWRGLVSLGFGHIEIGTVTLKPQSGNPKPRVFRLVEDQGLINRMGFPGEGASFTRNQVTGDPPKDVVIGVNIGKNKDTPLEQAGEEYAKLVHFFGPLVDYLTINVSSPNTVGLRDLQEQKALAALLKQVGQSRQKAVLEMRNSKKLPILIKLSPDLDKKALDQALDVVETSRMDGVVLTNTTLSRKGLSSNKSIEPGGLSGAPLFQRSLEMVKYVSQVTSGRLPIVAAGGVMNPDNAQEMLDAGASLIQVYTGLIYAGPGLVRDILFRLQLSS